MEEETKVCLPRGMQREQSAVLQLFVIKQSQSYDATTDAGICKVEDGTEEDVATHKRHPIGPNEQGEIEHVYYPSR